MGRAGTCVQVAHHKIVTLEAVAVAVAVETVCSSEVVGVRVELT